MAQMFSFSAAFFFFAFFSLSWMALVIYDSAVSQIPGGKNLNLNSSSIASSVSDEKRRMQTWGR